MLATTIEAFDAPAQLQFRQRLVAYLAPSGSTLDLDLDDITLELAAASLSVHTSVATQSDDATQAVNSTLAAATPAELSASLAITVVSIGATVITAPLPSLSSGRSIAPAPDGGSFVTGYFSGTQSFGSSTLTSSGRTDVYVMRTDPDGAVLWAVALGGGGHDYGNGISTVQDSQGQPVSGGGVYVTGSFTGIAAFGSHTLTSTGTTPDCFVVKLSDHGVVEFAHQMGGAGQCVGTSIAHNGGAADQDGAYVRARTLARCTASLPHTHACASHHNLRPSFALGHRTSLS